MPGSKNSHQARGFLSSARTGDRSCKGIRATFRNFPERTGTKVRADLCAAAAMRPSQTGKSSYKTYSLDWQDGQVANPAVGSKVFKGIVTLWPNCSDEAVTRTYVSKNKIQKELRPHRAQRKSAPWLSKQHTRDSRYVQTCNRLCNPVREESLLTR